MCVFSLLYNSFAFLCNSCSYATTFSLDFYQRQTQYRNWAGRTLIACNGPMGFPVITWGQYLASWCCLEQPSSATLVVTCCRRTCLTCFACRHATITTLLRLMWFLCEIPPAQWVLFSHVKPVCHSNNLLCEAIGGRAKEVWGLPLVQHVHCALPTSLVQHIRTNTHTPTMFLLAEPN